MKWEYLIFNILIAGGATMAARWYPRGKLPKVKMAAVSIFLVGGSYVIWDMLVAGKWWNFNPLYVWGWKLGGLPVEEMLFFVTVPWACLVIWENIRDKISGEWELKQWRWVMVVGAAAVAAWAMDGGRWYTAVVAGLAAGIMLATGSRWGKSTAVLAAVVTVLNLMCNGYLTARPVVVYNRVVISGVRVGTVPVEDLVYGWILVWGVVKVYEKSDKIK